MIDLHIFAAIYGYNFCSAARRAFKMLTSNVMRVAAINSVGTFVLFLAKVAVVVATVFIGMAIMRGKVHRSRVSLEICTTHMSKKGEG